MSIPVVYHQRFIQSMGDPDLLTEDISLDLPGGKIPVVIQADLTHGHHFRMPGDLLQLNQRLPTSLPGIVRMNSCRGKHPIIFFRQVDRLLGGGQIGPDVYDIFYSGIPCPVVTLNAAVVRVFAAVPVVEIVELPLVIAITGAACR